MQVTKEQVCRDKASIPQLEIGHGYFQDIMVCTGDIADGTVVKSFTYTFPAGSADGVSPNVIDGTLIKVGDELT